MTTISRLFAWGSVALYCLFIFFISSQSQLPLLEGVPEIDKAAHMAEYAVLGWLFARALRRERPRLSIGALVFFSAVFVATYGASDEWHQAYVLGRYADRLDFLADLGGGALGAFGYAVWFAVWRRGEGVLISMPRP